jgi:outer membrane protein TolC
MFHLADEQSTRLQQTHTAYDAATAALSVAKSQRLPDISSSLSFSYLGDGRIWKRNFTEPHNVSMPHYGNNFALLAQQTIYAGGAINSSIALAELDQQMAQLSWDKNRQDIRFLLAGYYLNLLKLKNQTRVLEHNINLTEQVITLMQARRQQGTALKNDITRYELQRENQHLQLTQTIDEERIINHQIVTVLHLPADTEFQLDTTLLHKSFPMDSEDSWQTLARQNNNDLRRADIAYRMSTQQLRQTRSELRPKISLLAEEHLDGPITIEVPALNNNFNYWFVGVGVRYSLSSLFKSNKKVRQATLQRNEAEQGKTLAAEQLTDAIHAAYINMQTALTDLSTQQKSVELADQNYDVTARRYMNGLALLTDMLDASNIRLAAELNLEDARINLIYCHYKLRYASHTL